jgi:hypothetical protein
MNVKDHLTRHSQFEKVGARIFNNALKEQIKGYPNFNPDIMAKAYRKFYLYVFNLEATHFWNTYLSKTFGYKIKDATDELASMVTPEARSEKKPFWKTLMEMYLSLYFAWRIGEVNNTTLKQIAELQIDFNLPQSQIKRILANHAENQRLRANTISRTETTNAINKTQHLIISSTGADYEKAWVAIRDDATRDAHFDTDPNEFIDYERSFIVGGEQLNYPGDLTLGASAWNVINCRCAVEYRLK